jgi:hypothetical protein
MSKYQDEYGYNDVDGILLAGREKNHDDLDGYLRFDPDELDDEAYWDEYEDEDDA